MPARSLRAVAAAIAFLTRIPVGRLVLDADDVARGAALFPLVGAGIGAAVGATAAGLDAELTVLLAAAAAVTLEALLTGAIHLDALADTADGLGAGTKERALEIMRDPAVGSFGATALALDLLVKVAALAAVAADSRAILAVVAAFALGRAAPLTLALALPYARPGSGSGLVLTERAARASLVVGIALALGISVVALGLRGLALAAGAGLACLVVGFVARRRLKGVTGDVLGASTELATTAALVAAVVVQA
jgi:cobalamin 5'-phosphate synthase/cobalamin synthase